MVRIKSFTTIEVGVWRASAKILLEADDLKHPDISMRLAGLAQRRSPFSDSRIGKRRRSLLQQVLEAGGIHWFDEVPIEPC